MRVAYIGNFPFPGATAATHRVRGVARALTFAGHKVTILPLLEGAATVDTEFHVDASIARLAVADSVGNAASILLGGGKAVSWLKARRLDFDVAVVYGTPAALLARYFWWAHAQRTAPLPVVLDVVEWYEYSSRPGGRFGPFAAEHAMAMNILAPRASSAICISTYLARHLRSHGCAAEVVPPMFSSMQNGRESAQLSPRQVHIGYAGSPAAKDGLGLVNLIAATAALPEGLRSRVQIQIAGLNEAEGQALLRRYDYGSDLRGLDNVHWYGRLPSGDAQGLVAACDYTYLQRPRARYAMAGFPTKVVESLVLGTPVIVNATSDLAAYVDDGRNGVWLDQPGLDGATRPAVSAALLRILAPGFRLALNRKQIGLQSSEVFHPRSYAEKLDSLLTAAVARGL